MKPFPVISSSMESFTEGLADQDGSRKNKQRKWKKSKHKESTERSHDSSNCGEEEPSPQKKQKKALRIDTEQYKPGMLSDLLQKKKYGYLILPWETSFGKSKPRSDVLSERDGTEQKPKVKINPLFDTSKRNEENVVSKSCTTYTIFVGNLPEEVTVNQVKKIFKKFSNTITKIKIRTKEIKNQKSFAGSNVKKSPGGLTNQCKHAIVKFRSLESHEAALKMNGKLFNGYHLRITGAEGKPSSDPEKGVFVGNLSVGVSDNVLWKTFENCGEIESVRVIKDKLNNKGVFGYINFQSPESVDEALKLDGMSVLNREIRVSRINKNIDSLSNSINVKRNKKKKPRPQLNGSTNTVESTNTFDMTQKKSSKCKPTQDLEEKAELNTSISQKKKKKKKSPADETEEH